MSIETHAATLWHGGLLVTYIIHTTMVFVPEYQAHTEKVMGLYGKTYEVAGHQSEPAYFAIGEVTILEQDGSIMARDDWRWERLAAQVLTDEESHREWSRTTHGI